MDLNCLFLYLSTEAMVHVSEGSMCLVHWKDDSKENVENFKMKRKPLERTKNFELKILREFCKERVKIMICDYELFMRQSPTILLF